MKVLHLIKTPDGATWAFRQIKVLVAHGVEVAVCLPKGKIYDLYVAHGIKVYDFNFSIHPAKLFKNFNAFRQIVNDYQPDIIHSHFVVTTLFARLFRLFNKLKVPLVFQVPGPLHLEHFFFKKAELSLKNKHDYWIASCNWTKDTYLKEGIPVSNVFLSYYGTDMSFVKKEAPGTLRKELNLKEDDFIVAMVAYMYAPKSYLGQKKGVKGHEDFIEAVAAAIKKNNKIKAVVIGGAWDGAIAYEQQLKQMGKELAGDNIFFLGSRSDVPKLYADINLVVHPSYSENLGGAAESLLMEVPTVATRVGGFPDVVIDNITGHLIRPGQPAEIEQAIARVMTNYGEEKAMAQKGRERILDILDVAKTGKEVKHIYEAILAHHSRN
jgi:glycosyltransferase involved in cell wall biosynthesis